MMPAGTAASARLTRHPHPPLILAVPKLMKLAARMPMVIMSWNPMLSMPRRRAGAI
ncbi:unnamed protein product, partial [Musa textilis]